MTKVKIIADSTCDLTPELCARYGIDIVPLYVTIGEKSYRDRIEITAPDILSTYEKTRETPKTAATSVGDLIDAFRPYAEAGQDIVFLTISSQMSAEFQNAMQAAAEFPGRTIIPVDTLSVSTGVGILAIEAAERAEKGMSAAQIASEVTALRAKVRVTFVIDTLTFLHRGGRCSGLKAFSAMMLNIKPKIGVVDGKMGTSGKFRGNIRRVIERFFDEHAAAMDRYRPERAFITVTSWPEDFEPLAARIRDTNHFRELFVTKAGSVITSHGGPNTVGFICLEK